MLRRLCLLSLLLPLPAAAQDAALAVGRVDVFGQNRQELCSGTLVAPDRVLTAAHCVIDPDGYAKPHAAITFIAAWDGTGHGAAARVASVAVHPQAVGADGLDIDHDIAVLRLDRALDGATLGVGNGPANGPFTLLGYSGASPDAVARAEGCQGRTDGALIRIRCAIARGQSGGPVVYGGGAGQRVVAVLSAISGPGALAVPIDGWTQRALAAR